MIRDFEGLSKGDVAAAGGKGASLGEMTRAGIPVPGGFVVLSSAFDKFVEGADLNVEIDAALNMVDTEKIHTVEEASERIQGMIVSSEMPQDIAKEIEREFKKLDAELVAVRSSATAEDSASAAWAGQLDTYLNTTRENLLGNVKKCWASLFTPRAIFYRFEKNLQKEKVSVAVVVQKMVESEESGIAFSVHPVTEDPNQLIIEAGFGLGEAIVSGKITPDSYVVDKQDWNIIDVNVNEQARGLFRGVKGGVEWKDLGSKGDDRVLGDAEVVELSKLIVKIEQHYGFSVDIEWAREGGEFFITQSRPITTLSKDNLIKEKQSEIFIKQHSREYSLFRVYSLYENYEKLADKIFGFKVIGACQTYGGDLVDVYYTKSSWDGLFKSIGKKVMNKSFFEEQIKKLYSDFNHLLPYFNGKKKVSNKKELKEIYKKYVEYYLLHGMVFAVPRMDFLPREIKDTAIQAREKIQEYNETIENVFKESLEKLYPHLKEKTQFILPNEVWSGEVEKEEEINEKIKAREKGFVFYRGKIYTGYVDKILDDLGIVTNDEKIQNEKELTGQSAFKGKVKGEVKIVSSVRDLSKVQKEDILVSAMTMPKYLPAMKRASAFVTDEGGVTCHAAIVAREMKKPCIIGTKFATKLLKDGDKIEVDADNGVVRVLDEETLDLLKKNGPLELSVSYPLQSVLLLEYMSSKIYEDNHLYGIINYKPQQAAVMFQEKEYEFWTNVSRRPIIGDSKIIKEVDNVARDFYKRAKKDFGKMMDLDEPELKKPELYTKTLNEANKLNQEMYWHFALYIEESFDTDDDKLIHRLQETRMLLDDLALNYLWKVYAKLVDALINIYKVPKEIALSATTKEVIEIVNNERDVSSYESIAGRAIAWVHVNGKAVTLTGREAIEVRDYLHKQNPNKRMEEDALSNKLIKGFVGNKGKVKGKVRKLMAIDYENKDKLEALSKNGGFVLVVPMTSPESVNYFKNAAAFVTDEGGLTCHAAIIAREMGVPCVVGTKVGTKVLSDGDEVEVDAEKGMVKILESGKLVVEELVHVDGPLALVELHYEKEACNVPWASEDFPFKPYIFYRRKDGMVYLYYDREGIAWQMKHAGDYSDVSGAIKKIKSGFDKIKDVLKEERTLNKKEFEAFLKKVKDLWPWLNYMWWAVEEKEKRGEDIKDLIKMRKYTEYFTPGLIAVMKKFVKNVCPEKRKYADVLLLEEAISGKLPSDEVLERRLNDYGYTNQMLYDSWENVVEEYGIDVKEHEDSGDLTGQTAFPGKARGKVHIIKNRNQINDFKKGEILVASTTTPDFLPAMKKAGAIISEHGGAICHAAITARELQKPCVIGTKSATKVLKDGDLVEVDAEKGTVKILR